MSEKKRCVDCGAPYVEGCCAHTSDCPWLEYAAVRGEPELEFRRVSHVDRVSFFIRRKDGAWAGNFDTILDGVNEHARLVKLNKFVACSDVDHPSYYGGDTTYEAIKVIEAWKLDFCLGNAVKYISRAGKKDPTKEIEDLRKAAWYLERRIQQLKEQR